jgi:hypothetical protein
VAGAVVVAAIRGGGGARAHRKKSAPMVAWARCRMQWGQQWQIVAPVRPTEFPLSRGHRAPSRKKEMASCA